MVNDLIFTPIPTSHSPKTFLFIACVKCLAPRDITQAILVLENQIKNRVPYFRDVVQLPTTHNLLPKLLYSARSFRKDAPAYLCDVTFIGHSQLHLGYLLDTGRDKSLVPVLT